MRKERKQIAALILAVSMLGGCATQSTPETPKTDVAAETTQEQAAENVSAAQTDELVEPVTYESSPYIGERPILIQTAAKSEIPDITPCVEPYTLEPGLGNVDNLWQIYALQQGGEMADKFTRNGFVVCGTAGSEFFEVYENNRYEMIPNFITVDSLMHTYHLYFAFLLKTIEKDYLSSSILELSARMLDDSIAQYEQLKGSEWESAAKRNVAFFTVGSKLLD